MGSCFGNFSMGELGNTKNLTLNNLKSLGPVKFQKIDGGKCAIPGFAPPQLPNFVIPPLPLFGGIPPFPLLCFLPPFPGIPALSLPAISIPLPPIPFLPPIPLPIPGFALPFLPLLPSFDLGSLDFLCGLININLPVLDPFASLNKLLTKLNGLIAALNDFLNFCKQNAETINATQTPPDTPPSIAAPLVSSTPSIVSKSKGISTPNVTDGESVVQTNSKDAQATPKISFSNIKSFPTDPAVDMAIYLANEGIIPPEPSIINQVATLLAPFGTIGNLTEQGVQQVLQDNNIPSATGFIGFQTLDVESCLELATDAQGNINCKKFLDCLISRGLLSNNANVKSKAFSVVCKILPASGLEVAIALNSQGVPFGNPATNLNRITAEDISRAFFIRRTTSPLTAKKITDVLVATGILSTADQNVQQAQIDLSPLPIPLIPTTIAAALSNVNPGPSSGSLKAVCIAATRGVLPQTLLDIDKARSDALLQSVTRVSKTSFVQVLSKITLVEFRSYFSDIPFPFPFSIYDIVPILAVKFNIDDAALTDLLANFKIPSIFEDIESLFSFVSFVAQTSSSQQQALNAITSCNTIKEGDFDFNQFVSAVSFSLRKYSIVLPSSTAINMNIANALQTENNFDYVNTLAVLGDQKMTTSEELTFLLLATGIIFDSLGGAKSNISSSILGLGTTGALTNPIRIDIRSPTRIANDIIQSSVNVTLSIKKIGSSGIVSSLNIIIQNGVTSSGTTAIINLNDFSQVLEIIVTRISGFDESQDAIEKVLVQASYSTALSTTPLSIPQSLIQIGI